MKNGQIRFLLKKQPEQPEKESWISKNAWWLIGMLVFQFGLGFYAGHQWGSGKPMIGKQVTEKITRDTVRPVFDPVDRIRVTITTAKGKRVTFIDPKTISIR